MMLPDPLLFSMEGIARHGGLVDLPGLPGPGLVEGAPTGEGAPLALLPEGLRKDLGLPEEVRLCRAPEEGEGCVPCGLGSPLLQRLVSDARAQAQVAAARLLADPPRVAQAAGLGERAVVRNGPCELLDVFPGEGVYVAASVAYAAEADDRHEGVVQVVVHAEDGAVPDGRFAAALDLAQASPAGLRALPAVPAGAEAALPWVLRRAPGMVEAALQPVREAVQRRHARDHARVAEYFAALIDEARRPRRRLDPAVVAAKLAHLRAERDVKLQDLQGRFTLRVSMEPAALLCVVVPVLRVRLRARRRKSERELITRLPAGAQALDAWSCDGCGWGVARPALCDDRMHLLCERCAPLATGRPRCPACRRA